MSKDLPRTISPHTHARVGQDSVAFLVVAGLRLMDRPIHLDRRGGGMALTIHDQAGNELLPPEVEPCQPVGAQAPPEDLLRLGHLAAQVSGKGNFISWLGLQRDATENRRCPGNEAFNWCAGRRRLCAGRDGNSGCPQDRRGFPRPGSPDRLKWTMSNYIRYVSKG